MKTSEIEMKEILGKDFSKNIPHIEFMYTECDG